MGDLSRKDILNIAKDIEGVEGSKVSKLLAINSLAQDQHFRKSVSDAVFHLSVSNLVYPFNSYTTRNGLLLGETANKTNYRISKEALQKHSLVIGQSGSGKTTLFYSLMGQLDAPFWVFDLKRDYRHLVRERSLLVLPWDRLRFNPLRPPSGVSPRRWAQVFAEIFGHATGLLSGSKNYLLKQIIELFRLYNLFEENRPPFPSLFELQSLVEKDAINYVRTSSDYRDRVLNRLEALTLTSGPVLKCSQGYSVEELLERNVVFEFDGLNRDLQNFLMEILFASVYEYRLAQNQRSQGLNHVFFLDEGKRVFSVYKERQAESGIPEIDDLTAKMREFGEGLVVADQEASKLTDSIKANTYTKVLLPTGDRKQFQAVAESMNLSERQREFAQKLSTGEAIVQVGNQGPVPVKLDHYPLEKTVDDEELARRMADKWDELHYTERQHTPEFELEVAPGRSEDVPEPETVEQPDTVDDLQLSDEAVRLLHDIVDHPFKRLTDRYDQFSSRSKGNQAKDELLDTGIIFEKPVSTGDSRRKLVELTDKGRQYCEEELDLQVEREGRGGVEHCFWQHRIQEMFEEAGWTAVVEVFDADVYVNMDTTELVVEVAMGNNEREIQHVKQHLETGYDSVWIATKNPEIRRQLKERLEENGLDSDRVVFQDLHSFSIESISSE